MTQSLDWSQLILPVLHTDTSLISTFAFSLGDLSCETFYDVRVRAVNRFGQSHFSQTFRFYVKTENSMGNVARSLQSEAKDWSSGGGRTFIDNVVIIMIIIIMGRVL